MPNGDADPPVEFDEFTEGAYASLLDSAVARYQFAPFGSVPVDGHALWRHDIDMSPHRALRIAQLEADRGVRATYFVLLHSPFYSAFEREVLDLLHQIARLGHWFGLHFELGFGGPRMSEAELIHGLTSERDILASLIGEPVDAFSFHHPGVHDALRFEAGEYAGMVSTYGEDIRREYRYVSDSNGYWRMDRLDDVLREAPARLHVLTHPEWWVPDPLSPRARVARAVEGRARWVLDDYDAFMTLHGRRNIR